MTEASKGTIAAAAFSYDDRLIGHRRIGQDLQWEDHSMIVLNHHSSVLADTSLDLQRASDFQAALLGMAGHDLRQPLQIIQSAYEWLGSRVAHTSEKVRLE